ncbi:hypothetical protein ACIRQU_25830, partial [Streptomyces sp. NPDC101206]
MADIRFDTSGLTHTQFSIIGHSPELVDGASVPVISLEPGIYGFQQLTGQPPIFTFEITQDGSVQYDLNNREFLDGAGTDTLTVRGFAVTIDARELSHDLTLFLLGNPGLLSRERAHELVLAPGT